VFAGKVTCGVRNETSGQSWPSNTVATDAFYQTVTDRIISSLKAGMIPWEERWKAPRFAGGLFPRNTGKPCCPAGESTSFCFGRVSTALHFGLRSQALKGNVGKGEQGTPIVFCKQLPEYTKKDEESTGEDERVPFVLCHYTVFNVEQCDGLTLPEIEQPTTARRSMKTNLARALAPARRTAPRSISIAPPSTGRTTLFLKKTGHLGSCAAPALVGSLGSQVVHPFSCRLENSTFDLVYKACNCGVHMYRHSGCVA